MQLVDESLSFVRIEYTAKYPEKNCRCIETGMGAGTVG